MKSILDESKCYSQNIPIEKLYPSALNMFDTSDISDLIASIRAVGLLSPLTVCGPDANGMYEILAGERRYLSLKELGKECDDELYKCPPCRVLNADLDQDRKELIIILSNMEVREISDLNVYRFRVVKLLKAICINSTKKRDCEAIRLFANQMGFSRRYAAMYFSIFGNKIRDIQDLVAEELVPVAIAARACNLTESYQHEFATRIRAEMQKVKSERKAPAKILEEIRALDEQAKGRQLTLAEDLDDKMPMAAESDEQTADAPTVSESSMDISFKPCVGGMDPSGSANPQQDFTERQIAPARYDMDEADASEVYEVNEQRSDPSTFTPEPMPQNNSYSKGTTLSANKAVPKPSIADDMALFGDSELIEMSSMDTGYMSNPYSGNYTYCAESESSIDNDTTGRLGVLRRYSNVESEDNAAKTNTLIHKQLDRIRNRAISRSLTDEDYKMIEDVRAWLREVDELIVE